MASYASMICNYYTSSFDCELEYTWQQVYTEDHAIMRGSKLYEKFGSDAGNYYHQRLIDEGQPEYHEFCGAGYLVYWLEYMLRTHTPAGKFAYDSDRGSYMGTGKEIVRLRDFIDVFDPDRRVITLREDSAVSHSSTEVTVDVELDRSKLTAWFCREYFGRPVFK